MTSLERPIRNILESDHQELDVLLAEAESALAVADPEAVFRSLDLFWARLAMHIRAEHVRLFPALREARVDEDRRVRLLQLLAELRHDHDFFMVELARAIAPVLVEFTASTAKGEWHASMQALTALRAHHAEAL